MHITVDIWLSDTDIQPNYSATGIALVPEGSTYPRVTLFLGTTPEEINANRARINTAIDRAIEARTDLQPEVRRE